MKYQDIRLLMSSLQSLNLVELTHPISEHRLQKQNKQTIKRHKNKLKMNVRKNHDDLRKSTTIKKSTTI